MPRETRQRRPRRRRILRWCRISLLAFILAVFGCFLYFNVVGLPRFLKSRLVAELRSHGVDLEFERLRFRWFRGLVGESVRLGDTQQADGLEFSASEVALNLDGRALWRLRFHVDALVVHDGQLTVPLPSPGEPTQPFVVSQITTELRLLPDDRWELDQFRALCLGARLNLYGTLTNASGVRNWRIPAPTNQPPGLWRRQLRRALDIARQIKFREPPQIHLEVQGDGGDPAGVSAGLRINVQDADTIWGRIDKLALTGTLNRPSVSNDVGRSDLTLQLEGVRSRWASARFSRATLHWSQSFTSPVPSAVRWDWEVLEAALPWGRIPEARFTGHTLPTLETPARLETQLALVSGELRSDWFELKSNRLTARVIHSRHDLLPAEADWQWEVARPQSRWGEAQLLRLNGRLTKAGEAAPRLADARWSWWAGLEPFHIDWQCDVEGASATNIVVDKLTLAARWRAPDLTVEKLQADLYGHQLAVSGRIDVATREAQAEGDFNFDVHRVESVLTPLTQHWLSQFAWTEPPRVTARGRALLPAWTNTAPDWRGEVLPTLTLEGSLSGTSGAYRGVPVDSARSHFTLSNLVWHLPDFVAVRPEGSAEFSLTSHVLSHAYQFNLRSRIDPRSLKPWIGEKPSRALDAFEFTDPPLIEGEVRGFWRQPELTTASVRVAATNFAFRGGPVSALHGAVKFANGEVTATDVEIAGGEQRISAPEVRYHLATQMLHVTNAVTTADPQRVTRMIGPQVASNLSHYVFQQPPTVRVNGSIMARDGKTSDLRFDITGGPFRYWRFNVPQITGTVLFVNQTVTITNLDASFYDGRLTGDLWVDAVPDGSPDFRLRARVSDTDLHLLMNDLASPTNKLAGRLTGELTVTNANAADWTSWNGYGQASLREGFLWDIPLFGIFSPLLDAVTGLGSSRANAAVATYAINRSVIHTDDMEIRSPAMRLAYRGTVDFSGRVNARVEARVLQDVWMIGPMVSLVFSPLTKLFEYKVTGTLGAPEKEPLYIPKPLMFPLHPFKTLKEMFGEPKPETPPPPE